jgi:hypothetical protein
MNFDDDVDIERNNLNENDFVKADFDEMNGLGEEFFINENRKRNSESDNEYKGFTETTTNNNNDYNDYPKFSDDETEKNINQSPQISHSPVQPHINQNIYQEETNYREPQREYMSQEEEMEQKKQLLYQFERLEKKGVPIRKFNLTSDLNEMKWEYERIKNQRDSDNAIKTYRKGLIVVTNVVEILNSKFDPFDIKLDGWSENIYDDIEEYDDVFEELHDKYKGKVKIAPELRLLGLLAGSGFMYHFQQASLKNSKIPGADEILKSDPELMKQFQKAAANSDSFKNAQQQATNSNPMMSMMGGLLGGGGGGGLGGLMSGLMGGGGGNRNTNDVPREQKRPNMEPPQLNINELLGGHSKDDVKSVELNDDDRISDIISLSGADFDEEDKNQTSNFNPNRKALIDKLRNRKKSKSNSVVIDL